MYIVYYILENLSCTYIILLLQYVRSEQIFRMNKRAYLTQKKGKNCDLNYPRIIQRHIHTHEVFLQLNSQYLIGSIMNFFF